MLSVLAALPVHPNKAYAQSRLPEDRSSAVVISFFRIGEDSLPDSSLQAGIFSQYLRELSSERHNAMSLPDILNAIQSGQDLPDRSFALTFDGAFLSAFKTAFPQLIEKKIPFTVFLPRDLTDKPQRDRAGWNDIKKLEDTGLVTFGIILDAGEPDFLGTLNRARVTFREHLNTEAELVAYDNGLYTASSKDILKNQSIKAAFTLDSGAVHLSANMLALPRFTMTDSYGDPERFRSALAVMPLPVMDIQPSGSYVPDISPAIGFTVPEALGPDLKNMSCFASGQKKPKTEIIGNTRIELRLAEALSPYSKTRINCIMPGPSTPSDSQEEQRWRWLGMTLLPHPQATQTQATPLQDEPQEPQE